MINEHIEQLQTKLEQAGGLPETDKAELLKHVAAVKSDVTNRDGEAGTSSPDAEPSEGQHGLDRLMASIEQLETSHPDIAASINNLANSLAKMGF